MKNVCSKPHAEEECLEKKKLSTFRLFLPKLTLKERFLSKPYFGKKNINLFKFCFNERLTYFDHVCVDNKSIDSSTVKNLLLKL